jgi:hypothetical protein
MQRRLRYGCIDALYIPAGLAKRRSTIGHLIIAVSIIARFTIG